jgi:hypothetical protein
VIEVLEVFSKQGHSGSSAPFAINYFKDLAAFKPLSPITCTEDEWGDVSSYSDGILFQNIRNSAVFKEGEDGKPYYIDAIVWKTQNGGSYTGTAYDKKGGKLRSSQSIKLPFSPKTFYIDVIEVEVKPDDFEFYIKDETQLNKVWKYYEKPLSLSEKRLKKLQIINDKFCY